MDTSRNSMSAKASTASDFASSSPDTIRNSPAPAMLETAATDYVYLGDVLGSKVAIVAGAEARREASRDDRAAKAEKGVIEDLIVDQRSGMIESAIVSFGGFFGMGDKTVALPIHLLVWNAHAEMYDVTADIDQLKALPACNLKEARESGLDREMLSLKAAWANARLGSDGSRLMDTGAEPERDSSAGHRATKWSGVPVSSIRYVAASDLDSPAVFAVNGTDHFGKVDKVIVDRGTRRVAYFVVSHGGALGVGHTDYLIARDALTPCQRGEEHFYCIDRSVDSMTASGVRYEKPEHGAMDSALVGRIQRNVEGG